MAVSGRPVSDLHRTELITVKRPLASSWREHVGQVLRCAMFWSIKPLNFRTPCPFSDIQTLSALKPRLSSMPNTGSGQLQRRHLVRPLRTRRHPGRRNAAPEPGIHGRARLGRCQGKVRADVGRAGADDVGAVRNLRQGRACKVARRRQVLGREGRLSLHTLHTVYAPTRPSGNAAFTRCQCTADCGSSQSSPWRATVARSAGARSSAVQRSAARRLAVQAQAMSR